MKALLVAALTLVAVASSPASVPPTRVPGEATVALSLPSPGLQAGSVQGTKVVFAKGLEPDLARALAARLGVTTVRFVNERLFSKLVAKGEKPWDFAIAAVTITPAREENVSFTAPYMTADQGVLVRKGLSPIPSSIAGLRGLQLCSERATTGAQYIVGTVRPAKKPQLVKSPTVLFDLLRNGTCDAAVYDTPILGAEVESAPDRYGPLAGRIATGERYGLVLQKGSALVAPLNAAVNALVKDGTITRLARRWMSVDPAKLPLLR